jgi:hypothetical protein
MGDIGEIGEIGEIDKGICEKLSDKLLLVTGLEKLCIRMLD